MARLLVADLDDRIILARLTDLASRQGYALARADDPRFDAEGETPVAVAVDLGSPGTVDQIAAFRRRWPTSFLAGSIGFPDQERWHGAVAAGADLVANRGAFVAQLARALEAQSGGASAAGAVTRLPVRLMEREGDGLVGRERHVRGSPGLSSARSQRDSRLPPACSRASSVIDAAGTIENHGHSPNLTRTDGAARGFR